jgi:hypothetical protein
MIRYVAGLSLMLMIGCAAQAPPEAAAPAPVAATCNPALTPAGLKVAILQNGGTLQADLDAKPLAGLQAFIQPQVTDALPEADRAVVFSKAKAAMVVWFLNGCMVGRTMGPWAEISRHLGIPV